jgi:hypothetical protein
VAKNFDAPIKLLFPRGIAAATGKMQFSMLGLGDIVIPGLFVALMLRMDAHRAMAKAAAAAAASSREPQQQQQPAAPRWDMGNTPYFRTAIIGYVVGLVTTIVVMNVFNAAQVWLVPEQQKGCLIVTGALGMQPAASVHQIVTVCPPCSAKLYTSSIQHVRSQSP